MKDVISDIYKSKMSLDDNIIKRFIEMKAEIKRLEKEVEFISNSIKEIGPFNTVNYSIAITKYQQERIASLELLIERFGRPALGNLIKIIDCSRINISEKTEIEKELK